MQPHNLLSDYLNQLEAIIIELPAYAEKYVEEVITPEQVNLRLRLRFDNGNLLEVNEAVVVENSRLVTEATDYGN